MVEEGAAAKSTPDFHDRSLLELRPTMKVPGWGRGETIIVVVTLAAIPLFDFFLLHGLTDPAFAFYVERPQHWILWLLAAVVTASLLVSIPFVIRWYRREVLGLIEFGSRAFRRGDLDTAAVFFGSAAAWDPKNAVARYNRGLARLMQEDLAGAEADFSAALRLDPQDAAAHRNRGLARILQGDEAGARSDCDAALHLLPEDAVGRHGRGITRNLKNDYAGAVADYRRAIEMRPACAKMAAGSRLTRAPWVSGPAEWGILLATVALILLLGVLLLYILPRVLSWGGYESGVPAVVFAALAPLLLGSIPFFISWHRGARAYKRGLARFEAKDFAGAIAGFTEVIRLRPKSAAAFAARGLVRVQADDAAGALADFDEVIRLAPKHAFAFAFRGRTRLGEGDIEGAIADCETALGLDPKNTVALVGRGLVRKMRDDFAGAIQDFDEAIRLDPRDTEALVDRALVRIERSDFNGARPELTEAIRDLDEALRLDPEDAATFSLRGTLRILTGDPDGGMSDLEETIRLAPDEATPAYGLRARARADRGDYAGAIADCEAATRLNPESADELEGLAWLLATVPDERYRDGPRAVELARKAVALTRGENYSPLNALAAALAETWSFEEAARTGEEALRLLPDEETDLRAEYEERLQLYREGMPWREEVPGGE